MKHTALPLVVAVAFCAGPAFAAENPNLAPRAQITPSAAADAAAKVADGRVPPMGGRDDRGTVWMVNEAKLPASLVFAWKEPVTVSTVVYYGRTTWGFEVFKNYASYLDDAETPVVEGAFRNGHGPQPVTLPTPTRARKLRLEFRSTHGGVEPGAAEVQIFAKPPAQEDLLCRFTDLSLDYRYAYYPSHNLVRIHLPTPPADATDWHLALRPEKGGAVLAERSGKLPAAAGGEAMPVPDLAEGDYTLTLTLTGGARPVIEERGIRRERPEWEGNNLGRDEVVIPPFTPLEVDGERNVVRSVLRAHAHGAAGLWRQVVSQERELLAGPVRIEVTQGGKVSTAAGPAPRFTGKKPTAVSGEAAWTAGALTGTTRFAYDYDGMQTIALELAPTETEVERVQLVIPLKAAEAWLMHPVTTQLRQHLAGRIPALPKGSAAGKVWDSSGVPNRLNGNFVPYIYLGGPERGICFAADNDKDWITDGNVPMMVIDREGDSVLLRLNLVAKPSRLTRKRTLTFALQATPAKPMPEAPYNWRRWWATGTDQDVQSVQINFWGGNMYWGGRHFATSVFPAFKDYGFWEQLAESRRTGKHDSKFEEAWMARFKGLPQDAYNNLKAHFRAGLSWAPGMPAITPETKRFNYVIPYTNPRGAHFETPEFITTYLDEWLEGDLVDRRWPGRDTFQRPLRVHPGWPGIACWYEVEPVPSRIDMLLFYHKKMLETFADGIYWDNWFLQPSYVPAEAGGPGYVDDAGRPQAGVNLMGFRDLVRRTATMMHVMGKRPLTYIHMTNVKIVPTLAFGTAHLDWEWRDQGDMGSMDLQDRIGLDEILMQSLGLQAGNLSVGITGNILKAGNGVSLEWLNRTAMAVCFPHEIRMHQGTPEVSFAQTQLARFGYGLPDCRVYRYWEEGFPLRTQGAEMRALVLARDGKAMIALGNFGPEGVEGPEIKGGPTLAEYDAQQLGRATAPVPAAPAQRRPGAESYTIRFRLDLKALGIPETARAWDVELRADRVKAAHPRSAGMPAQPVELKRLAPGLFELTVPHHDFALIVVE
ncbi:MAG: discoidin domain-containing protein [Verrucomicrobia bacterium]|nr:discoidin domain-containing protein [Verrucomicrobiota bacterium]